MAVLHMGLSSVASYKKPDWNRINMWAACGTIQNAYELYLKYKYNWNISDV